MRATPGLSPTETGTAGWPKQDFASSGSGIATWTQISRACSMRSSPRSMMLKTPPVRRFAPATLPGPGRDEVAALGPTPGMQRQSLTTVRAIKAAEARRVGNEASRRMRSRGAGDPSPRGEGGPPEGRWVGRRLDPTSRRSTAIAIGLTSPSAGRRLPAGGRGRTARCCAPRGSCRNPSRGREARPGRGWQSSRSARAD